MIAVYPREIDIYSQEQSVVLENSACIRMHVVWNQIFVTKILNLPN